MRTMTALISRNRKLFFRDRGMFLSSLITPVILIVLYATFLATVYKGNIIKNLIMDCQSYTKYRPNETTGGIFVSWRRKEEPPHRGLM